MGHDAGHDAADGVGTDGFGGELTVAEGVEHSSVGAQIATPTHTYGGEHGNGVIVYPALLSKVGYEAEGGTHGTEGGDGEGYLMRVVETEEPLENQGALIGKPRKEFHTLIGGTGKLARCLVGAEGENHHRGADDEHAGNDSHTDFHTGLATVENGIEDSHKERFCLGILRSGLLFLGPYLHGHFLLKLGVGLASETLHQTGADDTTAEGTEETHKGCGGVALTHHKDDDEQAHTEGCAEVRQRDELVLAEEACELLVVSQRDDGGVVAEEGEHSAEGGCAGQVEEGLHQRAEDFLKERHHAELAENLAQRSRDDADGHKEEASIDEQVEGRLHDGVHHIGHAHNMAEVAEDEKDDNEARDAFKSFLIHN